MKALTIWQPWASLILVGAKPYEFRGWRCPRSIVGQRIAIHAGARPVRRSELLELFNQLVNPEHNGQPCLRADIARPIVERLYRDGADRLPLGHMLCTAVLGEPKPGDACAREFGETAGNDSDRPGTFNWGWPLTEIEPIEPPVPVRGAQGFWDWQG